MLLIDADPQGSALDWAASRQDEPLFNVVGLPKTNLHREVPAHARHYTHVVIDGPPRVNALARSAILAADRILIPVQPSPYDVWAAREIVELIGEAQAFKDTLKSAFVINRKIVNTAIGRAVRARLGGLSHSRPQDGRLPAGRLCRKRGHGSDRTGSSLGLPGQSGNSRAGPGNSGGAQRGGIGMAEKKVSITAPRRSSSARASAQRAENWVQDKAGEPVKTADHRAAGLASRPGQGGVRLTGHQDERPGPDAA